MTISDLYPWLTGAIGGLLGAAFLLLCSNIGSTAPSKASRRNKSSSWKKLKEQLNHLADRGKRSNELEFAAVKAIWEKFVEAFLATRECVVNFTEIPLFGSMTADQFEAFLLAIDFTDLQKDRLRNASDKEAAYTDIVGLASYRSRPAGEL